MGFEVENDLHSEKFLLFHLKIGLKGEFVPL